MEFRFNLRKSHVITVLVLLVIVSFGIAQSSINPGHAASQVDMGSGLTLTQWGNNIQTGLNNHDTAIANLQSGRWNGYAYPTALYSQGLSPAHGFGYTTYPAGTYTHNVAAIPANAKEMLVFAYIIKKANTPPASSSVSPIFVSISTREGSARYEQRLVSHNARMAATNGYEALDTVSDNMWFPVTADKNIYVELPFAINDAAAGIAVIGYR